MRDDDPLRYTLDPGLALHVRWVKQQRGASSEGMFPHLEALLAREERSAMVVALLTVVSLVLVGIGMAVWVGIRVSRWVG